MAISGTKRLLRSRFPLALRCLWLDLKRYSVQFTCSSYHTTPMNAHRVARHLGKNGAYYKTDALGGSSIEEPRSYVSKAAPISGARPLLAYLPLMVLIPGSVAKAHGEAASVAATS